MDLPTARRVIETWHGMMHGSGFAKHITAFKNHTRELIEAVKVVLEVAPESPEKQSCLNWIEKADDHRITVTDFVRKFVTDAFEILKTIP
jgi:hypothetical protein